MGDDYDDDEDEDPCLPEEEKTALDLGGFEHHKSANQEYYSPFLRQKREYLPLDFSDPELSREEVWARTLNKKEDEDWESYAEIGCIYKWSPVPAERIKPLPPGVYDHCPRTSDFPERLSVYKLQRKEEIVEVGQVFHKVKLDIAAFLQNESVYKEIKTTYKLGLLLYGPPGNGKSVLVRNLIDDHPEAIVIYVDGDTFPSTSFLNKLNSNTSGRLKIFVFEELTSNTKNWYISKLLAFLDGENSLNHCITIATTNYPEVLPENIVNRPSRFDKLYEFGNPNLTERKQWLKHFMGKEVDYKELLIPASPLTNKADEDLIKDFSVAAIKELCLLVRINNMTIKDAALALKERFEKCHKKFEKVSNKVGF